MQGVYTKPEEIDFDLSEIPARENHTEVLMVDPEYFRLDYDLEDNDFMDSSKTVDRDKARSQWESLKSTYEDLGIRVNVIEGQKGFPDMVFCANQSLPSQDKVLMSNMANKERKGEVKHIQKFYEDETGLEIVHLSKNIVLEGSGDAIYHPGRKLIWGGIGSRTEKKAYEEVRDVLDVPVITLGPEDPWYHLDTCFSAIDEDTVMISEGAFDDVDRGKIEAVFETVIEVPESENRECFACNAHSPDGKNVIIQKGAETAVSRLEEEGYTVYEVDTSEFMKAGGSVFCMKRTLP